MTKRTSILTAVAFAAATVSLGATSVGAAQAEKSAAGAKQAQDVEAIQKTADAFTKAFNAGDAKTIAGQFTPDGEMVDVDGSVLVGQEGIQKEFEAIFTENPGRKIEIAIDSLRFIGRDVAIEEGRTTVSSPGGETTTNRYTAIHVKRKGQWSVARVQDSAPEMSSNYQRLRELDWMVGDWVDEEEDSLVITSCRWSDNKNYLLREFTLRIEGMDAMKGTVRIGWDPLRKQIRSWVFDSEGGFAEGFWTRQDNRWIVKMSGVTRDGQTASSTNITTFINKDRSTWQSIDRVVGGEIMPDVEEVIVVRKPPKPGSR